MKLTKYIHSIPILIALYLLTFTNAIQINKSHTPRVNSLSTSEVALVQLGSFPEGGFEDNISSMSDESILEFSNSIAATEVPKVVEKPKAETKKREAPKKLEKLPEVDEYSAMLMYTQSVHDSYAGQKNQTQSDEEQQAKKLVEAYEREHPDEKVLPNVTAPEKNDYRSVEVKNKTKEPDPFLQEMGKVNMTDPQDVIHAAIAEMQHEETESKKPKKKPPPKPMGKMWENLAYLEQQQEKFSQGEEKSVPQEEESQGKPPAVQEEVLEKIDPTFDSDSLQVYGYMLNEQLSKGAPGNETATPAALVEKVISDIEKEKIEKRRQERVKKAEQLLEDVPMSDDQQKDALIQEWTSYAELQNTNTFKDLPMPKTLELLSSSTKSTESSKSTSKKEAFKKTSQPQTSSKKTRPTAKANTKEADKSKIDKIKERIKRAQVKKKVEQKSDL